MFWLHFGLWHFPHKLTKCVTSIIRALWHIFRLKINKSYVTFIRDLRVSSILHSTHVVLLECNAELNLRSTYVFSPQTGLVEFDLARVPPPFSSWARPTWSGEPPNSSLSGHIQRLLRLTTQGPHNTPHFLTCSVSSSNFNAHRHHNAIQVHRKHTVSPYLLTMFHKKTGRLETSGKIVG